MYIHTIHFFFFAVFVRIVHRWVSRHSKKKKKGGAGQLKVVELNYKTSPDYYSTTVVGPKPQSQNNKKQWNCRRGTVTYNIYKIVFAAVVLRLYLLPFKRGTIPSRYDPTQFRRDMTQPNYHLMKVKAKIHSKNYSVERRKTEGRKEKTKTKKQTRSVSYTHLTLPTNREV